MTTHWSPFSRPALLKAQGLSAPLLTSEEMGDACAWQREAQAAKNTCTEVPRRPRLRAEGPGILCAQPKPASADARNVEDRFHNVKIVMWFTNCVTFFATSSGFNSECRRSPFLLDAAVLAEPDLLESLIDLVAGHWIQVHQFAQRPELETSGRPRQVRCWIVTARAERCGRREVVCVRRPPGLPHEDHEGHAAGAVNRWPSPCSSGVSVND